MISIKPRIRAISIILVVAVLSSFCAAKNFLTVNYQLPTESVDLKDTRVVLTVKDIREDPRIVTPSAKKALKNFTGHFALIVAQENKEDRLVGAFSLSSMIREIFYHRLENAGVQVVTEEDIGVPIVEIVLKEFKLDLANRNWVIKMNYQANLIKQNRVVGGEKITGSAERLRIISGKNAEIIIGELVTDVVNRLNLNEFLQLNQIQ
jgi:nicotinamide mononucleotide adenylyltransferase